MEAKNALLLECFQHSLFLEEFLEVTENFTNTRRGQIPALYLRGWGEGVSEETLMLMN